MLTRLLELGELGREGIFRSLDRADALDHRLAELGSVEEAMSAPPAGGRAEVRGLAIRELYPERRRYSCSWSRIFNTSEDRMYDMSDPYGRSAQWREQQDIRPRRSRSEERRMDIHRRLRRGIDLYQEMDLCRASELLGPLAEAARSAGDFEAEALARFWCATAHQDRGNLQAAEDALAPILETVVQDASHGTACRVLTRYALVLIGRPVERTRIEEAVERVRASHEAAGGDEGRSLVSMVEARFQGSLGHSDQAIEIMERALDEQRRGGVSFARSSYLRWLVCYLVRTGQLDRASAYTEQWRGDVRSFGRHHWAGITLACAESMIARCRGQRDLALARARAAVECSNGTERHRYRVSAICALIESAVGR